MEQKNDRSFESVKITRLSADKPPVNMDDDVAVEKAITIMIDKVGSFTVLATPDDIESLAVGFLFSEGMIDSIDDVVDIIIKPELPNVIGVSIGDPSRISISRNMIVASSCGMCGARNIVSLLETTPQAEETVELTQIQLNEIIDNLRSSQQVFKKTGATHAAGIFDSTGDIFSWAEDIGRHNALDKAVGNRLIQKQPAQSCGVVLSSRASFEMIAKSARANAEIVIAVSAPSSLAIEAADKWNITLCGFVRPGKANVYTHRQRIKGLDDE